MSEADLDQISQIRFSWRCRAPPRWPPPSPPSASTHWPRSPTRSRRQRPEVTSSATRRRPALPRGADLHAREPEAHRVRRPAPPSDPALRPRRPGPLGPPRRLSPRAHELLDALRRRDVEGTRELMGRHILHTRGLWWSRRALSVPGPCGAGCARCGQDFSPFQRFPNGEPADMATEKQKTAARHILEKARKAQADRRGGRAAPRRSPGSRRARRTASPTTSSPSRRSARSR